MSCLLVINSHFWVPGLLGPKPFRPGTPRPGRFGPFFNPGLLGPLKWDCSAHFFLFFLSIFFFFFFGGGGNLLFYSVYVHQNKIQETLFGNTCRKLL